VAVGEEEAHSSWVHDALLHGETLLVVAASDFEDVAFEFFTDAVAWDFGSHTPMKPININASYWRFDRWEIGILVHENTKTSLIIDLDKLLTAIGSCKQVSLAVPIPSGT